ncbi:hypothetical protein AK830_g684 [Neonectria ditissima]|uniref:Uncharacterized protein n=1 Tax=Neonectria ditissima TaxID=78410 RepID=A0A0P7C1H8_9HYPO|nr:hypothetical protein AK830_g684 [Neonectria ditissima]
MPLPLVTPPSGTAPPVENTVSDIVVPLPQSAEPNVTTQDANIAAAAPPAQNPDPNAPAPPKQRRKRRKAHEIPPKGPPKKRGPKPKPLSERVYKAPKPIQRVERSYDPKKKEEVILYLMHHRVYDPNSNIKAPDGHRPPTFREAAAFFGIPSSTIGGWYKNKERLEAKANGTAPPRTKSKPKVPAAEPAVATPEPTAAPTPVPET